MPVVDLAARAARCLAVGLRQLTKALESPSVRKSAELKRHLYQECLFRVANSLDPGSVEYVLPSDNPPGSLMVVAASCVAGSHAAGLPVRPDFIALKGAPRYAYFMENCQILSRFVR
jgi:hypothetical protein